MDKDLPVEDICSWCEDSGILLFDFDDHFTVGDECPSCIKPGREHGLTLEEFEEQLKDRGYTEDEIAEELERIEAQNENLGC